MVQSILYISTIYTFRKCCLRWCGINRCRYLEFKNIARDDLWFLFSRWSLIFITFILIKLNKCLFILALKKYIMKYFIDIYFIDIIACEKNKLINLLARRIGFTYVCHIMEIVPSPFSLWLSNKTNKITNNYNRTNLFFFFLSPSFTQFNFIILYILVIFYYYHFERYNKVCIRNMI